jgi:hypothetical protein
MARLPEKLERVQLPDALRRQKRPSAEAAQANGSAQRESESSRWEARELRAERDRLLEKFTIMQTDLGGAFYEMAIRDHVQLDALTRKAAELQKVDQELAEVEAQLEKLGRAAES